MSQVTPNHPPDPESDPGSIKAAASAGNASGQQSTGDLSLPTTPMPAINLIVDV